MEYYNPDTKKVLSYKDVCSFYNTSFPMASEVLAETWHKVHEAAFPAPEDGYRFEPGEVALVDGKYVKTWKKIPLTAEEIQNEALTTASSLLNPRLVRSYVQTATLGTAELALFAKAGMFAEWAPDTQYNKGARLVCDGIVYEVQHDVLSVEAQPPFAEGMRTVYLPLYTDSNNPQHVEPTLEEVKARKVATIDAETSSAIMAGFECEATPPDTGTPELLHFSYDEFDQQNFADAAVSMQLATASDGGIPTTTPWNAYRNHTADSKGDLVILQLTAETFLPLYAAALNHKATKMAEGGQRKAAVAAAQTVEEVEAI